MIKPPTNCPSCEEILTWVKDTLYCTNDSCPAKSFKQIEHFAKTLKIKGLGPRAIEKLELEGIEDIYSLDLQFAKLKLNSELVATKLLAEIEASKKHPLDKVIPAFGIPLIGNSAAAKLAEHLAGWHLVDVTPIDLTEAGLGPKASLNFYTWLQNRFPTLARTLPFKWRFEEVSDSKPMLTAEASKGVICITGKLTSFKTKGEATAILENLGYVVKDRITKDVTILVNESGKVTAKTEKAEKDGIQIVTNLKNFIGE